MEIQMTESEWKQLKEMRECIKSSGMQAFDPAYMDSYAQLLAKSLAGKGDMVNHKTPTNY
jgi:hypothetical protein